MKKSFLILFFLGIFSCFSQEDAWIYFTDKPNASSYLANPLTILTQRSLDRRAAQGIELNNEDVPIAQIYIDQVTTATGITIMAKSKWLNALHVRGTQADIQAVTELSFVSSVEYANQSLNSKTGFSRPINSTPVNKNMNVELSFDYGTSANQIQMLNGHLLHQQNFTGAGKIIAVLDSGFSNVNSTLPFQRLFDNNLILGGYNYVSQNTDVYSLHNHGTMVLSCMGGFVDGQLVGTAPDAQYYLFVTEDVASENPVEESYWVEAAEEADRLGVDVITSSLGYFGYDNPNYSHVYSEMTGNKAFASRGANIAFSKGIVVIASAGNSGATSNPYVGVPAEATNVLAIGAVKADETYATFSSIGPSFDGRVKPDLMAQGQTSVVSNTSGTIVTANGTSFSAPIMTGMVTSFWSAVPNLTAAEVVQFVKQSADRFTVPSNFYGYGIPDFQLALTNALTSESFENNVFLIYPNPINQIISVKVPEESLNSVLKFYNNLGQSISEFKITNTNQKIPVENLASGIYFYEFSTKNKTFQGKLLKL